MSYSFTKDPNMVKELLLERENRNIGGVECLLVGKQGCGKTTALAQIAIENKKLYKDVIVWRGSEDCQWSLLLNARQKLVLHIKDGVEMTLFNRNTGKNVSLDDCFVEIKRWHTPKILIGQLQHDKINIIQSTPYTPVDPKLHLQFCIDWLNILMALNKRRWNKPITLLFDEFEDLVPEGVGKKFYDVELSLSGLFRKIRKNDISSFLACHTLEDIHWRVKKKIRWKLYMRGAAQAKDSKIRKNLADLDIGTAIIEGDKFERFRFNSLGLEMKLRADITAKQL